MGLKPGMKKCPICGEEYASIYKRCPFCEEDENPKKARQPKRYNAGGHRLSRREKEEYDYEAERGRPIYDDEDYEAVRHGKRAAEEEPSQRRKAVPEEDYRDDDTGYRGRRVSREKEYDDDYDDRADYDDDYDDYDDYDDEKGSRWFPVVMVILVAIIIACVLYLGRGFIGGLISPDEDESGGVSSSDVIDDPHGENDETSIPEQEDGTLPDTDPEVDVPPAVLPEDPVTPPENPSPAIGKLELSKADVTLKGGESFVLSAVGGGDVTFTSKDPAIASVSEKGTVKGLKKGVTEITVRRGDESAVCIVRVKSDGKNAGGEGDTQSGSSAGQDAKLSHTDVTIAPGETVKLKVSGVSAALTWTTEKSSVAAVDGNGVVTGVAAGKTKVTASWDGQKLECIVRVK